MGRGALGRHIDIRLFDTTGTRQNLALAGGGALFGRALDNDHGNHWSWEPKQDMELYQVPPSATHVGDSQSEENVIHRGKREGFAMAAAVRLREGYDAVGLRELAKRSVDAAQTRRLLALAAIYDGRSRTEAAKMGGVGLQTVRDWVLTFNAEGPPSLVPVHKR